ncbi:MAG: hypothetical protein ABR518_10105 [Actinomycetota bacterium]
MRSVRAAIAAVVAVSAFAVGLARRADASGVSLRATPLNVLWRVDRDGDRLTAPTAAERDALGGTSDGQLFYVRSSGSSPLYRTFKAARGDHRDARSLVGSGGYVLDGALGAPWPRCDAPGMAPIHDAVNASTGDHATVGPQELLVGYSVKTQLGCGYPRYGTAGEDLLTTSAGGVTVSSNRVAGGAVWRWTHRGMQYVNTYDYGREIQAAIFIDHANPTEAGDGLGDSRYPADLQGSPLLMASSGPTNQSTRAAPLEFSVTRPDGPAVYQSIRLGKDLTLDFRGMGPVVRYDTFLTTSRRLEGDWQTYIQNVAFLRPLFRRFFTYDAADPGTSPREVFPGDYDVAGIVYEPPSGFGGVIIADDSLSFAMGMYGVLASVPGGTIDGFSVAKYFTDLGGGPADDSESSSATSAMDAHSLEPVPAGTTIYRTWIITGTVDEVASLMTDLYRAKVR